MRSKSVLAILLVFMMVISTACGVSNEVKQPASVDGDSSVTVAIPNDNEDETVGSNSATEETVADDADNVEISIAETVLYDADGIVVTATGYEEDWMGPTVKVLVENNTTKNVLITVESMSVNGFMMPYASMYAEVAAGKKANESISFSSSSLEQAGIDTIAEMQFHLDISDADSWDTLATSDLLTLNTSVVDFTQPVDDSGDVIYDANGIKVVCKGLKQDVIWDGTVVFYMENNSGKPITVYAENVSVNGFMENASLWSDLRDGTKIVDGLSLLNLSDLELESIDEVENIEFNLRITNSDSWDLIDTTDVISLNFK